MSTEELTEEQLEQLLAEKRKEKEAKREKIKKEYHESKELFLNNSQKAFEDLHNELKSLKKVAITKANQLYNQMYEIDGKEPKETKSFSLKNEADTVKLTVDRQERFEFTEEAIVHINSIRDIFKNKFANRNMGMYKILDGLLIKNSKMEYDPKLLAKARRQVRELGDNELIQEFDKLDECQRIVGTSQYCRLYVKGENGKWDDVSLSFSSL